ncbi:MAG: peptide deformylase [Acidobacteriota bacterium]|nr:peptide deformylase [Acidobacteriota bacterium]
MAIRRILQLGDPVLREISREIGNVAEAAATFADLRDTLHEFQRANGFGRGISAVQIGALERAIYIEFEGAQYRIANPMFEFRSIEKFRLWDDCFSFPDLLVYLERSQSVRLRYIDEHGSAQSIAASGPFSELLQHEMDHLDGILAVDRAVNRNSLCTREEFQRVTGLKRGGAPARPIG